MREDRQANELRPISIDTTFNRYAEGSALISFGHTRVLCTASVEDRQPPFLRHTDKGWVTAEYGMLPRATHTRGSREAARGKQGGRTVEIQRVQATAEDKPLSWDQFTQLKRLADKGIADLAEIQNQAIASV